MKKTPVDHAKMLLGKAAHDLSAARAVLAAGQATDIVAFHAQQAVEKSLKAVLGLDDIVYPRTHSIVELIALAKPLVAEWSFDDERLARLSQYAVDVRYNDLYAEASPEQAREALETAEFVHLRVGMIVATRGLGTTPGGSAGG